MSETWNERTLLLLGQPGIERLAQAHVLIIDLGGVGAWVAENLCRAGVGKLTIADGDTIHPSNRNRQLIALNSTDGKPKAEVVAARLKDINPTIEVVVIDRYLKDENLRNLVEQPYDYVVDAIDTLSPKLFLLTHAVRYGHRVASSMGAGGKLDPSKVMIADISKTHTCPLAWILRKRLHKQGIFTGDGAAFVPLKAFPLISYTSIQKIGDTWWACSDKGLWKWEEGQEQAEPYFADQPFGNLQTYGILQDEGGHYWVSSASGLYRFREDSPEPKPYLTHIEFNKRSFAAIRDSFYFGSVNGLVAFNPLDFPLMDAQSAGRQPNPAYLKPGIILLLAVVVVFFYVQWKRTQRRIDSLRHKQRQRDAM